MEYDIREFEILHELEGETKIFEDKYPTYFLVILCEKDIMFLGRYTGKLFSEFNKSEPIGYIGRRNSAREVRESAEKMMIQIKAGTKWVLAFSIIEELIKVLLLFQLHLQGCHTNPIYYPELYYLHTLYLMINLLLDLYLAKY